MIWNSYPKPYVVFIAKPSTYAACYLIEFCQIVVTLSEIHFILPWSRSRTCFHHMLCFYTRSKQTSIHKIKLYVHVWHHSLSKKIYIKDMGLCEKKIKDAYPKKVCHMLRHVKKKEGKKKIAPYPKRKKKERWCIQRSSYTIHQKYPHTCTSWSRFMTCFSFGSGLWLSKMWETGMPSNPPYLQLHKNSH